MKKFLFAGALVAAGFVAAKVAGPVVTRAMLRASLEMTKSQIKKMEDEVQAMMDAGEKVPEGTLEVLGQFYQDAEILQKNIRSNEETPAAEAPEADAAPAVEA